MKDEITLPSLYHTAKTPVCKEGGAGYFRLPAPPRSADADSHDVTVL